MATAAGTRAAPAFLTRSLIFTPSHNQYRAGKSSRKDPTLTYRVFIDLRKHIRQNLDPYRFPTSRNVHTSARRAAAQNGNLHSKSAIPHISLHIAASSSGKGRKYRPELSTYEYIAGHDGGLGLQRGSTLDSKRAGRPDS